MMAVVKAFTEFSEEEIGKQGKIASTDADEEKRKKAKRFQIEMIAYNMRALRGDFDLF